MNDTAPEAGLAVAARRWPRVVSVVLNWRRPDETEACVRSLLAMDYPHQHILVVDNGAGATNIDTRLAGLPVEIKRNPINLGFTGGVNIGFAHALANAADYVWLVNSDATAAPNALRLLVDSAEAAPQIGLISPVFHDPDERDRPVFCLARQPPNSVTGAWTADPAEAAAWLRAYPTEVTLYGAALLVRRALIERIGLLDERFFAYAEDVDYCMRCHDAGFMVTICPRAVAYHTFKDMRSEALPAYVHYFMNRNQILLWRKYSANRLLCKPMFWYIYQRIMAVEVRSHDTAAVEALLLGLWDGMRGVEGPYDRTRRVPWLLRSTVGRRPGLFLNLIEGKLPWRSRVSR